MNVKNLVCACLSLLIFSNTNAQVSTKYTYTNSASATYTTPGGTVLCSGTGAGTVDSWYQGAAVNTAGAGISIGFPFVYNCVSYSTLGIHTNAFVWFGSGVPANATNVTISNASANLGGSGTIDGLIAAWAGTTSGTVRTPAAAASNINYTTSGTTPNRIFKVEWKGYKINGGSGNGTVPGTMIWLYETSNKIEVYANSQSAILISGTRSGQIGLRGIDNTDFKNTNGAGTMWSGIPAGTINTQVTTTSASSYPNGGRVFTWTFTGSCCTPPSTQATNLTFSSLTTSSVQLNWTNGDGAARVVVAHATTAVNANPVNGTDYTAGANPAFGSGTNLGSNNYVVYQGTGNSVTVTGLTGGTTYCFSVFEYNILPSICYFTPGLSNCQSIPACLNFPTTNATSMVFSNILNNGITLTYTRGNGSNVMVVARLTATTRVQPTFNISYTPNTVFGSGATTGAGNFVVLDGTANTVTITGLANLTSYTFDVYEYNASPNCYSTSPLIATSSTLDGTTSGGCSATVVRTGTNISTITPSTIIQTGNITNTYYQGGAANTPGAGIPIGFNFVYNNIAYSSFGLCTNGFIWFGSGVPNPATTNPISGTPNLGGSGTIDGVISAMGAFINSNFVNPAAANGYSRANVDIGYTVTGVAPNRVLTIQWSGYSPANYFGLCYSFGYTNSNRVDFQIKLNEDGGSASNQIVLAYSNEGPECIDVGFSAEVGLRGANNTIFTNRTGNGSNWGNTAGGVNTSTCSTTSGTWITGATITFTQASTTGPTVNGFASGGSASNVCPATSVVLTAGAGFGSYQWFLNGSIIAGPGSNTSTYLATQSGNYTVVGRNGTCYIISNPFSVTINSCGIAPTVTCPANVSQNTDAGQCNAVVNYPAATATGTPTPTITYSQNSGTAFPIGNTTVTVTATNGISPDATCTFTVTVTDNEPPVIGACPADFSQCDNLIATFSTPSATDNCAGTTVICAPPSGSTLTAGTTAVTCTATDAANLTSSCSFNVTINETPVITGCPSDIIQCDNNVATWIAPTATGTPAATVTCSPASGATFATGTTAVTCTATNLCGSSTCSFNVTINESPVISACPSDITQNNNHVATWIDPTASGAPAPTVTCSPVSGTTFAAGTTVVTCTATNSCGSSSCSFNVTINDGPVIGPCPSDIAQCNNHVATWTDPTATGSPVPVVVCSPASGSTFVTGTTVVTCTATNIVGSSSCSFNVTIDESAVIGACPSNITQCDNAVATWTDPTATGSPAPTVTCSPASGSTFASGTTSVTCTATNSCGISQCSFTVTINGTPVIAACPSDITTCNPVVTYTTPSATGLPAATVSCSPASGSTFATGTTVVTCTATNSCGNSACSFNVIVSTSSTAATSITSNAANNEICLGSNVSLTAVGGSLGLGANWFWYEGSCGGASLGSGTTFSITPSTSGTHTYFVRAQGTCNTTTCVSITITVKTAPPAGTIHITSTPSDGCVGGTGTVSVNSVPTATFYRWSCSSGGVLFNGQPSPYDSPTPSVTVTYSALPAGGASGWSICVFPGNACGNANTVCSWIRATISRPNPITGSVIGCSNTSATYSCNNVGAAAYIWSITGNASIVGNGNQSITVNFGAGFSTGTLCVHSQTSCGYNSADVCINLSGVTAQPGTIAGSGNVCPNGSSTFTVAAVPGATSYNWTCSVPGSVITNNGTSATIAFPASIPGGSSVCVSSLGPCGTPSATRCKGISSGIPSTPGVISGPNGGQCGATGVSYSINPVAGATGYFWTVNNGATISGPNTLSGITVDFPGSFTTVNMTVVSTNVCGNSNVRALAVGSIPAIPGAITGNTTACNGGVEFYSTGGSSGATIYTWTVPANATILGGQGSASIVVLWGATSGNVSVRAGNGCGNSALRNFPVSVITCRLAQVSETLSIPAEIFPNPTTGKTNIQYYSVEGGDLSIQAMDMTGRVLLSQSIHSVEGINIHELDLSGFAKGVYMIHLQGRDTNETLRITLE